MYSMYLYKIYGYKMIQDMRGWSQCVNGSVLLEAWTSGTLQGNPKPGHLQKLQTIQRRSSSRRTWGAAVGVACHGITYRSDLFTRKNPYFCTEQPVEWLPLEAPERIILNSMITSYHPISVTWTPHFNACLNHQLVAEKIIFAVQNQPPFQWQEFSLPETRQEICWWKSMKINLPCSKRAKAWFLLLKSS